MSLSLNGAEDNWFSIWGKTRMNLFFTTYGKYWFLSNYDYTLEQQNIWDKRQLCRIRLSSSRNSFRRYHKVKTQATIWGKKPFSPQGGSEWVSTAPTHRDILMLFTQSEGCVRGSKCLWRDGRTSLVSAQGHLWDWVWGVESSQHPWCKTLWPLFVQAQTRPCILTE